MVLITHRLAEKLQEEARSLIPGISREDVEEFVPLPPLAEQHRILAKVDALQALCDQLEATLTTTATTRRRLLNALLAEALAPAEGRELEAADKDSRGLQTPKQSFGHGLASRPSRPRNYVVGFTTASGKVLAIHREANETRIWFQPPVPPNLDGVRQMDSCFEWEPAGNMD